MATVAELAAGDLVTQGTMHGVFISRSPHPIWPILMLVIWRLDDGWSFDALDFQQEVGDVTPSTHEDRQRRLRAALLGEEAGRGEIRGTDDVSPEQRRGEIEHTLARYGATAFGYATTGDRAQIVFELGGRRMRLDVRLPDRNDKEFTHLPSTPWKRRSENEAERFYQQAVRQRWAALGLYLKAVCEAIDNGLMTAETAFLPYIVLPDGQTLGERLAPQLEAAYASGQMPALLPGSAQ